MISQADNCRILRERLRDAASDFWIQGWSTGHYSIQKIEGIEDSSVPSSINGASIGRVLEEPNHDRSSIRALGQKATNTETVQCPSRDLNP